MKIFGFSLFFFYYKKNVRLFLNYYFVRYSEMLTGEREDLIFMVPFEGQGRALARFPDDLES